MSLKVKGSVKIAPPSLPPLPGDGTEGTPEC